MLEINTNKSNKNVVESNTHRIDQAEERVSETEEKVKEILHSPNNKENKMNTTFKNSEI
jgi:hypothetical protein